jgi:uncharacterized protein
MYRTRAAVPVLVALTTLIVLSAVVLGGRPAAASAEVPSAGQSEDSVLVTGTGEVSGAPDMLTADFAVETTASAVDEALNRANAAATRMRDALVSAGLTSADLQTSNVTIGSQRDDDGGITGYTVSEGLAATIRNLPRAGALLSAAIAAGGDAARLNGVWYSIEDDSALLTAARKKAFADARAKAELYAAEAGRSLGRVVKVSEVTPGVVIPGGQDYRAGAGAPVPIEPGRQRLTATITVEWALQLSKEPAGRR